MRIILVSILVVCAFAAPITRPILDEEVLKGCAARDYARCKGLRIMNTVSQLRYYEVPEATIAEYLLLGLQFPPFDADWVRKVNAFGEKYNHTGFSGVRWSDEKQEFQTPESDSEEAQASFTEKIPPNEEIVQQYNIYKGLPEVAVEEFYVEGLHLEPVTEEQHSRLVSWGQKWGVKEVPLSDVAYRDIKMRNEFIDHLASFYKKAINSHDIVRSMLKDEKNKNVLSNSYSKSELEALLKDKIGNFLEKADKLSSAMKWYSTYGISSDGKQRLRVLFKNFKGIEDDAFASVNDILLKDIAGKYGVKREEAIGTIMTYFGLEDTIDM